MSRHPFGWDLPPGVSHRDIEEAQEFTVKIETSEQHPGWWIAVDDNTYDGPGSPIGVGSTEKEAHDDLCEQLNICPICHSDEGCEH